MKQVERSANMDFTAGGELLIDTSVLLEVEEHVTNVRHVSKYPNRFVFLTSRDGRLLVLLSLVILCVCPQGKLCLWTRPLQQELTQRQCQYFDRFYKSVCLRTDFIPTFMQNFTSVKWRSNWRASLTKGVVQTRVTKHYSPGPHCWSRETLSVWMMQDDREKAGRVAGLLHTKNNLMWFHRDSDSAQKQNGKFEII